ncbi:hypothetical protein BGZ59_004684 [Podila verticillata]|nr:hypothetical protein BGZ59_004684 [Podila verticillata]
MSACIVPSPSNSLSVTVCPQVCPRVLGLEEKKKEAQEDWDRLEKFVQDEVFGRVLALPRMRKVILQNDAFVKKAMEAINANMDLLNSNPQLPDLFFEFSCTTDITAIQQALKTLTRLKILTMNHVHITRKDQLSGVINNATVMQKLSFDDPSGISGDRCESLNGLTELGFRSDWNRNMDLVQGIELCLNLEDLKIPKGCPTDQIASTIKECCPSLGTVKRQNDSLEYKQVALLIWAPRRLLRFSGDMHMVRDGGRSP